MPRRTRTRRLPRTEYHRGHYRQLATGFDFRLPSPAFGMDRLGGRFDREAALEAWGRLRAEILSAHLAAHPCTRPWAWWHLEPRDLRRRVDGGAHPCEATGGPEPYYGVPGSISRAEEFEALYESVAAYLDRLGLLTSPERAYLADHPELLEPVYAIGARGWE
jgi:hypothetical protein